MLHLSAETYYDEQVLKVFRQNFSWNTPKNGIVLVIPKIAKVEHFWSMQMLANLGVKQNLYFLLPTSVQKRFCTTGHSRDKFAFARCEPLAKKLRFWASGTIQKVLYQIITGVF